MSESSVSEKLIRLECPHLGLSPSPESIKSLLFHTEDRIPILRWITHRLQDKLKANKENHDQGPHSTPEAPVLNLQAILDESATLEQDLQQLGLVQATDFVRLNLTECQSLGIWLSLMQMLDTEDTNCSKEEFHQWLNHPLTNANGAKGHSKLIPRDIERELPSNYKKLAVPSAAKSADIIAHFQRELANIQHELMPSIHDDLDPDQEKAMADQDLAILESYIRDFTQFNLDFETTAQRLLLNKDDSVPDAIGEPLAVIEDAMRVATETVEARETIQKVILDTNEASLT